MIALATESTGAVLLQFWALISLIVVAILILRAGIRILRAITSLIHGRQP